MPGSGINEQKKHQMNEFLPLNKRKIILKKYARVYFHLFNLVAIPLQVGIFIIGLVVNPIFIGTSWLNIVVTIFEIVLIVHPIFDYAEFKIAQRLGILAKSEKWSYFIAFSHYLRYVEAIIDEDDEKNE
ncbi:MAG: hypothetical protein ACRC2T_14500 [Thermoguttaceae bacterium]